jgi:predicted acyltransferase
MQPRDLPVANVNTSQQRLASLDAMRGFVMFLLLGGGEIGHAGFLSALFAAIDQPWAQTLHHQLQYSGWGDAFHIKDLIRPLFIFVVGVAMPYSFGKRLSLGHSMRKIHAHVLRRVAILFLLGTIAGGHLLALDRSKFYLVNNVLQEIAIGYLVASLLLLNFRVRGQLAALAALLLGYWALIMLVPVPGHGAGIITPEVNLPRYVDDLVLGSLRPVKWSFTWTLSLPLASSCIVLLGALGGQVLKSAQRAWAKLAWLVFGALSCLVLGLVWSRWYPIVVGITTGSWVLIVGAVGLGLLALFYLVTDVWGFRKSAFFFVVIGSNSIAVYMAAHLFDFRNIGNIFVKGWTTNHYVGVNDGVCGWIGPGPWSNFVEALAAFVVIWLIMLWMYRTKTFIKV